MKDKKLHYPRTKGIPEVFPFGCYFPTEQDIPRDAPSVHVGMDSGVSNTSFCYIELIRDPRTKSVIDFEYGDCYYYKDILEKLAYKKDRQLYLCEQYYKLFAHKNVENLTFELLPLTQIQNEEILKGVIDAQETTTLITTTAYALNHYYQPVPATSIKLCLTGKGTATKEDMCNVAFQLTGDERLLENDHMADAFAMAFYSFIQKIKADCVYHNTPIPEKFAHMDWNFKEMPLPPWKQQYYRN